MNAIPIESIEPIETPWPEFGDVLALPELALACAMSLPELHELMEYGALCPIAQPPAEPVFAMNCLEPLRKAGKLRRDYDLDLFVVVILWADDTAPETSDGLFSAHRRAGGTAKSAAGEFHGV
ncbi:MAG: hypothetical protein IPH35_08945 [Rhodoferax sp.]|nr:hypothetical protein [Rhodoferax sp.]